MTRSRRYRFDGMRYGRTIVGGSPLRLFRLTEAGDRLVDRLTAGDPVGRSALTDRLLDAGVIHPALESAPGTPTTYTAADVTIVVPAYGPTGDIPTGAILVDDGSEPPIVGADVRIESNQGPSAARNAGLAMVDTPLVAFLDTGVDPSDGWLERLVAHFDDPQVALVAPRVRSTDRDDALGRYERNNTSLDLGEQPGPIRPGSRIGYVPAAALVCRTEVIRHVGGFDTGLRRGEDVDLLWRLDAAGWRCRYEPSVIVEHHPRATWPQWAKQRFGYGTSAAPLSARHTGALAPLRANSWSVAIWGFIATGHRWTGLAIGAGTAILLVRKLPSLPARTAVKLATEGNAKMAIHLTSAVRRVWWPLVAIAAIKSRVMRLVLAGSALAALSPIRLADDVAYSVGVWWGMWTERTLQPIFPKIGFTDSVPG